MIHNNIPEYVIVCGVSHGYTTKTITDKLQIPMAAVKKARNVGFTP